MDAMLLEYDFDFLLRDGPYLSYKLYYDFGANGSNIRVGLG